MKKLLVLFLAACLLLGVSACAQTRQSAPAAQPTPAEMTDPSGQSFLAPESADRIVALSPAICEVLVALELGDKVVAADTYSFDVAGIDPEVCKFDMMSTDAESILALEPDLVLVSGISQVGDADPFRLLKSAGISVAYIPSSESLQGIYDDIAFIAQAAGKSAQGEAVISELKAQIEEIAAIGKTIVNKKCVLFEVSASPYIYSFGSGTFLNEMIEIIGATNVLAGQQGWLAVSDESAVALNPDVILTNVNYMPDPVGDILALPAFSGVTAVKNGAIYLIDANASSRPSQNIITALRQMAEAVYPDAYSFE